MGANYNGQIIESTLQKACNKYNSIFRVFTSNKDGSYEFKTTFFLIDFEADGAANSG
jgi:hypothetical protein